MKNITTHTLKQYKVKGEKITCITAYDATFARVMNLAAIELLLVGDTLGQIIQGNSSTIPVTLEQMCYHVNCVARGNSHSLIIGDMPFLSYTDKIIAVQTAKQLMQHGAHMVKLEGGEMMVPVITELSSLGVPVCGHIGLTPQSVHALGGYRIQGRNHEQAEKLLRDAHLIEQAGASLLVLECIPQELAKTISNSLTIPTIGIGAGKHCDGQVLVLYDLLGMNAVKFTFVQDFMDLAQGSILEALIAYRDAVKAGTFPAEEHSFN